MKKIFLFLLAVVFLAACGTENSGMEGNATSVESITVKSANGPETGEMIFKESVDIEIFLESMDRATLHTGPVTAEAPNFNFTILMQDGIEKDYSLWLKPNEKSGRFKQTPSDVEGVYILTEEDAERLSELIQEK